MGGPFMHWISIFGLVALAIAAWKVVEIITKKQTGMNLLGLIKMSASLALAIGFLSQIIGIVHALEAIKAAADVSPQIVMGGAIVSFYAPAWGLTVFVFAMLIYHVLKEIVKYKATGNN